MGFKFQVTLPMYAQEVLYNRMDADDATNFKRYLVETVVEAAQSESTRLRAIEVARVMVQQRKGG